MIEITFWELLQAMAILWIIIRAIIAIKNKEISFAREAQLLLVYICIAVIFRIVYFAKDHVNGHIDTMKIDFSRIFPLSINLVPIVRLFSAYDGWQINIIGNIAMFIPYGIIWPYCFEKLDRVWKTVLSGFAFSLLIEISQLLLYERHSDIDDIILNTLGVLIGALIYHTAVRRQRSH